MGLRRHLLPFQGRKKNSCCLLLSATNLLPFEPQRPCGLRTQRTCCLDGGLSNVKPASWPGYILTCDLARHTASHSLPLLRIFRYLPLQRVRSPDLVVSI